MSDGLWEVALWAAAISTGLMAGINRIILKSAFMPLFFCSSLLSLMLIILVGDGSVSKWIVAAGMVYLIGMLLCTMVFNVPLNNRLKDASPENESAIWQY